jgi:hypothetical protein
MTCAKQHNYIVEVIGQATRYIGDVRSEAVSALLTIDLDRGEEGYVVAEHESGDVTTMALRSPAYCPAESGDVENEAMRVRLDERARRLGWEDNAEMTHQAHNARAFGCAYCAA